MKTIGGECANQLARKLTIDDANLADIDNAPFRKIRFTFAEPDVTGMYRLMRIRGQRHDDGRCDLRLIEAI